MKGRCGNASRGKAGRWGGRALPCRLVRLSLAAALLAGCASPSSPPGKGSAEAVPAQARLYERLEQYHRALGDRDAQAMYRMSPPYVRTHMTLEAYESDLGMDEDWAALPHRRIRTKMEKACSCESGLIGFSSKTATLWCVLLLDSTITGQDGKPSTYKNLEMWEYLKGEWYFGYPGGGADACPPLDTR